MGLATNIGGGVQAFFYEPYMGAVQGPQYFVIGLGRGTGSLVGGVVGGAMMSTSSIVSTYSESLARGIASFGDEKFLKMRAETHRRVKDAAREGLLSGIVEGGGAVISGVAAGVTGVITKPVEGALRNGSTGFVRGVGIGVVGAVINPVLGIADGLNSFAQTILVQTSDVKLRPQVRHARTFDCILPMELDLLAALAAPSRPSDRPQAPLAALPYPVLSGLLALTSLSLPALQAQAQVITKAKRRGEMDAFVGFVSLVPASATAPERPRPAKADKDNAKDDKEPPSLAIKEPPLMPAVFLSVRYVFLRLEAWQQGQTQTQLGSSFSMWGKRRSSVAAGPASPGELEVVPWTDISHCVLVAPALVKELPLSVSLSYR